jgi:site-specific recombinase XerD
MLLRIEQGKGCKDRYAMLSPQLLELLRDWWRIARPPVWLFPGQNPVTPLTPRQLNRAFHAAAPQAGITKRVSPHTLLLGHAKLETTALYTRVATSTIRAVMSPLDRLTLLRTEHPPPA